MLSLAVVYAFVPSATVMILTRPVPFFMAIGTISEGFDETGRMANFYCSGLPPLRGYIVLLLRWSATVIDIRNRAMILDKRFGRCCSVRRWLRRWF